MQAILDVIDTATDRQRVHGAHWYPRAHHLASVICPGDPDAGAGVLAALSPNMAWPRTRATAARLAAGESHGLPATRVQVAKAQAILHGDDWRTVLRGPKERAFAASISDPLGNAVCVDRWALAVLLGRPATPRERSVLSSPAGYGAVVDAYRAAAARLDWPAPRVQATAWVVARDRWARVARAA